MGYRESINKYLRSTDTKTRPWRTFRAEMARLVILTSARPLPIPLFIDILQRPSLNQPKDGANMAQQAPSVPTTQHSSDHPAQTLDSWGAEVMEFAGDGNKNGAHGLTRKRGRVALNIHKSSTMAWSMTSSGFVKLFRPIEPFPSQSCNYCCYRRKSLVD